jgi:phage terminase large subunit GpA-like protein
MAPYMVEPADTLTAREFEGLIFVGPAQSGKTQSLILNFLAYSVIVDPMDMAIFSPTMTMARDFSIRRVDRLHRFSPEVGNKLLPDRDADNKYDKSYRSGTYLTLGWPTVSQFAGRPIGRLMLTDYDRMPDDIEGDGNPYDLASKRATTFGSFAMTLAESSPSRALESPKWISTSPHEAPPTKGILALYNRGDRRRFYWPCKHCSHWFEGNFKHLQFDASLSPAQAGAKAVMLCPSCGGRITFDDRQYMLEIGVWLRDGEYIRDGQIQGEGRHSRIASFWLNGVAASFISWAKLVSIYLDATADYEKTGSQEALKKFYNNDLGEPYINKSSELERLPEVLKSRAFKLPEREVPPNVRFLIAAIDVQTNMFVVQVYGVLPGAPFDLAVIDRYNIYKSKRFDGDGDALWCKPGTYLEDWDLITEQVLNRSYPLSDGSGRLMKIKMTACDSGGRDGVTVNAYNYWRKLKDERLSARFYLVKGEGASGKPRAVIGYPDSSRKDRLAGARGDVPVLFLNSNILKDDVLGRLDCTVPGKGMLLMPDWLPDSFFVELCAETRSADGWAKPGKTRNEAWDLTYYALGLLVSPIIRIEQILWTDPPSWARPWDENDLVTKPDAKERFASPVNVSYDLTALGKSLA